jgi:D-serine deaminase-like pyridoxal phosphate-dependent protein
VSTTTSHFTTLIEKVLASSWITLYGFYAHAGNAYASTSSAHAEEYLESEVEAVNRAASIALALSKKTLPEVDWVLSVGSTPTAHAASGNKPGELERLLGTLELHAGNYPMLDLQQLHTSLVDLPRVAQRVLATVISLYPAREEGMCDAGALAMSKDTGPDGTFGKVINKPGWVLGRVSQEHGILTRVSVEAEELQIGEMLEVVGPHACLTAAAYPFYYVVDSGEGDGKTVVDVWVPWKGW